MPKGGKPSRWRDIKVYKDYAFIVAAGLTPYQALELGIRNVAAFFGTLDSVGTVAVGKRADLVVTDGNPLTPDFGPLDAPAGVMAGGRWMTRGMFDGMCVALGCPVTQKP